MITLAVVAIIVLAWVSMLADSFSQAIDIIVLIAVLFVAFAAIGLLVEYLVNRRNRDR